MKHENRDILAMVGHAENQARRSAAQALIIQPGAIGDCILTLPLAQFLKTHLGMGTVRMLGKTYSMEYFPGRTPIDGIKDLDSIDLHRLFIKHKDFELEDGDSLISTFGGFEHIITFLGCAGSDFERNLIFTANCSNAVEVTTLQLKPPADFTGHVAAFYLDSFICIQSLGIQAADINLKKTYITSGKSDLAEGRKILESVGIKHGQNVTVIHPGSGGATKCWHLDNFYMLAESLSDKEIKVVFLLGPAEMERFKRKTIDALGAIAPVLCELSLTDVFQVVSCTNCFIGNDSGITHMAAAAGIPTIVCFGPTNPVRFRPIGPRVSAFKLDESDFNSPCPDKAAELAKQALEFLQTNS